MVLPKGRGNPPEKLTIPSGPVIQENAGQKSPARTYQDLLTNAHDEALFEYYMHAQVVHVSLKGKTKKIGQSGIIRRAEPSPDGEYILMETIHRPFSYLVPVYRFPTRIEIINKNGKHVHTLRDMPLAESIRIGRDAVIDGPRSFGWRSDVGSTIYFTEALDGGDPRVEVSFQDEVFTLKSPFNGSPKSLIKLPLRYSGIRWGNESVALVSDRKWTERRTTTWRVNPETGKSEKIIDRLYEDRYNDPGSPLTVLNEYGRAVLHIQDGVTLLMSGIGASPEGDKPFLDQSYQLFYSASNLMGLLRLF